MPTALMIKHVSMASVSLPVISEECVESIRSVGQRDTKPIALVPQDTLEILSNSVPKFSWSAKVIPIVEEDTCVLTINAKTLMSVSKKSFPVVLVQSVQIFPVGINALVHFLYLEMLMALKDVDLQLLSVSMMQTVLIIKDVMQRQENALITVLLVMTVQNQRSVNRTRNALMDADLIMTALRVRSVITRTDNVMIPAQLKTLPFNASVEQMPFARLRTMRVSVTVLLDTKDSLTKFVSL